MSPFTKATLLALDKNVNHCFIQEKIFIVVRLLYASINLHVYRIYSWLSFLLSETYVIIAWFCLQFVLWAKKEIYWMMLGFEDSEFVETTKPFFIYIITNIAIGILAYSLLKFTRLAFPLIVVIPLIINILILWVFRSVIHLNRVVFTTNDSLKREACPYTSYKV